MIEYNEKNIIEKSIKTIKNFIKEEDENFKKTGYRACNTNLLISITNLISFYKNSTNNTKKSSIDF